MNKFERLIDLIVKSEQKASETEGVYARAMIIADYLLEHRVDVQEELDNSTLKINDNVWYIDIHLSAVTYSASIIKGCVISIETPRSLYGCFTVNSYIDIETTTFKMSDIGTKVFRTREEAQQALKDYVRKL